MLVKTSAVLMVIATAVTVGTALPGWALPLSPGDRVRVLTPLDDELPQESRFRISGLYEVNLDGTLQVPFLEPQQVAGLETSQVEQTLSKLLIEKGYFRSQNFQLSVRVAQWAPVQVTVAGEAFYPGRVLINALPDSERNPQPRPRNAPEAVAGESPPERFLSAALRVAGGLKPTADIRNIRLIRGKEETVLDMSGVVTGQPVPDVPLIAGDQVIIPKVTLAQSDLVRPSQVTPTQISVLVSNLTQPNAAGGKILQLEYGNRFSQAVIAAGCLGGSNVINGKRRATLVQTDRVTGQTKVVDRRVEELIRKSASEADNPFLMPQDSVVCYDSAITNATGILRFITDIFSPFFFIRSLFND